MKIKRWVILMLSDIIFVNLSLIIAIYIRFESLNIGNYLNNYFKYIIAITIIKIIIFYIFRLYKGLWRYASIDEMIEVISATLLANIISVIFLIAVRADISRSVFIMVAMFDMAFVGGIRFFYRIVRRLRRKKDRCKDDPRVLIIGAGYAGVMVLKELRNHQSIRYTPVAFIDDDPLKKGKVINGVPVVGNSSHIFEMSKKHSIDEIIIAIPSAKRKDRQRIVEEATLTKSKVKILPPIYDLIDGKITINQIREVDIKDLLGRDEIELDILELDSFISNKTILVTGGGGSIGSELCRQIVKFSPKQLIIFDIYENSAYNLQLELLRKYKNLDLIVLIGTVRDKSTIEEMMNVYKPDIIFHAAAHKHVPLMETSPKDAIKNNVFGTLNLVKASHKHKIEKFIQISTDKAVNPTNVMGATKRLCEKIIQAHNNISETEFVAVRFGNVLGSNGSVIPLFKKQISEGGPVTVTDKDVVRYFMTIPEAAQLVLEAGAIAKGGEIFILDMGDPIKILDLAIHLIKLSGYEPYIDIPIVYTGLRPGEKLYEELLLNKDIASETTNKKIFIEPTEYIDYGNFMMELKYLEEKLNTANNFTIKEHLKNMNLNYYMENINKKQN